MKENLIDTSSPLSIEKWSYKVFQKGRKIKKWLWESLAGIVFLIIAFLAVLQWTFMHHSDDILGVILKEIVVIKSKERYRLTYDSIRLDFLRGKMYVDNARVIPDFAKMPTSKTIFHIEVPKIELKIASLWRAYFQKEIKLYDIRFKQPFVEVFSNTIQKDSSHEIKIDNLYYLIENYARKLEVNHFIINGGKFILRNHDNNQEPILIQNIHVEVDGFDINQQTNSPQRPFDAERIKLRISQNSIPLEKGKKLLYIGDLNIETDAQQITIRNLTLDSLGEGSNFSFKIPLIEFHKVDFKKLHFEKTLKIEELFIENPRIIIKNQKNNSQKKDISINPYELFSKYLHEININKIFLKKGFFSTDISSKNSSIHIEQPNIDISAFNLKIDSISQNERSKKFYIDDIELKISTIRQKINGNYISARKLFVSTKKSHIIVENLYLKTADNQKEVNLERFSLENFNLWNFIHKKELIASKITLEKPLFKLLNNEKQEIPHQTESIEKVLHDIYPQTSKLAKKIFVKEISIENGQIHIQKEKQTILVIDSLNTLLTRLNISKRKFDRKKPLFFADNLVLNSKKLYVFFPKSSYHFTANNIELNILEKKLKANDLIYKIADSLQGKTNIDKLYEINSKQVVIEGFKINEILLDSIICLNKFKIQNPSFIITNKNIQTKYLEEPTKRFDIFDIKKIQINSFLTENAQIQVRNQNNSPYLTFKDFNLIVNHLGFDSLEWKKRKSKLLYKDAKLYGYELSYFLPDSIHKIDIAFTSYNSLKKLFYLKNISISNNQITKENANIYLENRLSSIHLKGINLLDLQDNNILIDTLLLRQDFSKVLVLNNATESNNKTNFLENIQKIIQKTPFQLKLNYLNGQLKNNEIYTKAGSYGKIGNLIIELNQFSLDSLQNSKDLFFNKQNKFFINNITYYDKKNELSSEKIYFSFTEDSIHVEKLSIKPRIKNIHHCFFEENNRSSFFIDKLFVSKIGAYKFLSNNTIDVQEIRLENPHIEVYSKSKKTSSTFSIDSAFALIKSKFKEAKIGYLIVKDAMLSLNRLDVLDSNLLVPKVKVYTNKFYHLNLDISKWNIEDSTSFLKSEDVLFTSYKFMFPLPDSLNYLKSEKITLNIAKNQILLDSLELLPRYSKAEYALKSGKALDRFHLKTSRILLDN
ncbi:MAG: hypothetical protein RMJ89_00485, partial [Flammeovirgaceae bacterium]|nr:hypothetical protein [Flammeovirgaceae bacterium]